MQLLLASHKVAYYEISYVFRVKSEDIIWCYPANNHLNKNKRKRCEICSKLITKTPERRHWRRSIVFIVNFEHISHLVLMFLLLALSRWMPAGIPDNIYLLKINNRNIRKRSEICSKLTKSHQNNVAVVFLLLTLNIFQIFQTFF